MTPHFRVREAYTRLTSRTHLVDGLPPVRRRPEFWAKTLSECMDLLTYAAIYLTSEVQSWPFAIAATLTAVRLTSRFRLKTLWMVAGFLLQIFLGIELVLRLQRHPLVSAAHVAPIAMAWIGLSRSGDDLWGARLGLGFMGLILASALTPDFSVMLLILSFIITGSIALACRFLSGEFVRRGVTGSLPPGFIRTTFYQSGILLLAALLIFPLIPRIQGKGTGGFGGENHKTGYSEEVTLNEWSRVSNQGSTTPALRIYGPNGSDPNPYIPAGLLRSRILSVLDANRWNPAPPKTDDTRTFDDRKTAATLMIVREMIGPANLPVPYGTQDVNVELYGIRWGAERTKISEWREGRSRNQRFNYYVTVDTDAKKAPQDYPTSIELSVPANFRSNRMRALADRLFQGKKTPESKIAAVQSHFQKENFTAVYAEDEAAPRGDIEDRKLPPIERFLFVEKSGHCELFSSAMAILLRMSGVPTRLVAGFRVNRNAYGDVLTVRQSDAHAWVEAYVPNHGWTAIDPTPKVVHFSTVADWLRDTYDWASAKWTQYILNYGEGENSLGAQWDKLKKIGSQIAEGKNPLKAGDTDANLYLFLVMFMLGSVGLSFSAIAVYRRFELRKSGFTLDQVRIDLQKERERMVKICARIDAIPDEKKLFEPSVRDWFALYERARFGADQSNSEDELIEIRKQRVAIEISLKNAS